MGILRLAAMVCLGVVATGCAATASLKPGPVAATPVPWISATPPPYVPPTPSSAVIPVGTPACNSGNIVAAFAGSNAATGGQLTGTIWLGNRGGAACFLEGFPGIQLLDPAGHPIPVHVYTWTDPKPERILIQPGTDNLAGDSAPTGAAWVMLIWPTHDPATGTCSPPATQGTMIVLGLPTGGSLHVPVNDRRNGATIASCGGSLSVGPFEAIPAPAATPPPARFSIQLDTPASVGAGQTLRFTVRLRNITSAPIAFERPCPSYGEWGTGTKSFYVLNCGGVPPIQPGQSVSFAMQLQMPSNVGAGPFTIFWNLSGPDTLNQLPGKATIQVIR